MLHFLDSVDQLKISVWCYSLISLKPDASSLKPICSLGIRVCERSGLRSPSRTHWSVWWARHVPWRPLRGSCDSLLVKPRVLHVGRLRFCWLCVASVAPIVPGQRGVLIWGGGGAVVSWCGCALWLRLEEIRRCYCSSCLRACFACCHGPWLAWFVPLPFSGFFVINLSYSVYLCSLLAVGVRIGWAGVDLWCFERLCSSSSTRFPVYFLVAMLC